jgi:nickel transport system permease protein
MVRFALNRLLILLPLLIGITLASFLLVRLIPGDPAQVYLQASHLNISNDSLNYFRARMGLDLPVMGQYWNWLINALRLDFGVSLAGGEPVRDELMRYFPNTLKLTAVSMAFSLAVSIPLGVLSAMYKDSWFDHLSRIAAFFGASLPAFWLGFILMYLFSLKLDLLPVLGIGGPSHYVLPTITLSITYISLYSRLLRAGMLEQDNQPYIVYAKARGLSRFAIIAKYMFRPAVVPLLSAVGIHFGEMLSGAIIVEQVFAWPGIGKWFVTAVSNRDYPIIQCVVLITAFSFVLCNLAVDLLHAWINPRLRYKEGGR